MSDIAITNQLPPRATTSTRRSRKWSTLGGRCTSTSTTMIPTKDSDVNENSSKSNGHHRHSTSLFRKASTISRATDTGVTSDENPNQALKKSRSLMNVLRSKLNSPAVMRRFRSKSRESTKQTVTEINGHSTNEQQEVKQSNDEQITTPTTARKSRKRDPSPMRRLANRISQLTKHQRTTSNERQKKSPTKSITNDSHEETRKPPSPIHKKDEVDHINACYDEIRAKYYNNNNNNNINKRNIINDDTHNRSLSTISMNGSLRSNDFRTNTQHITSATVVPDDPLLQACKKTNMKLNCLLSGYTLTTSFANHEKTFGQNDLFKFNHYYDVGKKKYDWNFTNTNSRLFSNMRTRPISKSIDSFRSSSIKENEVSTAWEKNHIVDNDRLAQKHEDVPRILPDNNEPVIHKDNDLNKSNIDVVPSVPIDNETFVQTNSIDFNENKIISNGKILDDHDEKFEQNFLRAVDRALGVINQDKNAVVEPVHDISKEEDDASHMDLIQITERALSSFYNLPDFTDDDKQIHKPATNGIEVSDFELNEPLNAEQSTKNIDENKIHEPTTNGIEVTDFELDEPLSTEQSTKNIGENQIHEPTTNGTEVTDFELNEPLSTEQSTANIDENKIHESTTNGIEVTDFEFDEPLSTDQSTIIIDENQKEINDNDVLIDNDISSIVNELIEKTEELLNEECKNGQTFLVKLDDEEKIIKSKAETYNEYINANDNRLTEEVRTDINAVIGEVNLLLRGKLKQFRGLCQANVTKSTDGEPIPLDSDLEGFWDITYPLIDKVKEKFAKLDARQAKQWAPIEEYDPNDINNRPRIIDDRLKQLQPQQNKSSKIPIPKAANDDLKKLIQERRKAAANSTNQNHDIEIFVAPK
ncbi:unnamed protein product [Adineta steineri]|uniref:Uncharacterized protein n=1 Tax=Adineta steineri TaxID=433720 RepID=A0A818SMP8_9BILA|nr:unnamed protein product [Adineta steineri]